MSTTNRSTQGVGDRAVPLVRHYEKEYDLQQAANKSSTKKIGCTAGTPWKWLCQPEPDAGKPPGLNTEERERPKAPERELGSALKVSGSAPTSRRPLRRSSGESGIGRRGSRRKRRRS